MSIASASRRISQPSHVAWDAIADISGVYRFHPAVKASPLLSDNPRGLGAKRRCEFYDGTSVVEEAVEWVEGERLTLELSEASMPLKRAFGTLQVIPLSPGACEVVLTMDYTMKYGPLGSILDAVMVRRTMSRLFDKILAGLAQHLDTGELIGPEFEARAA